MGHGRIEFEAIPADFAANAGVRRKWLGRDGRLMHTTQFSAKAPIQSVLAPEPAL
jgi:hypothetical protein